MNDVTRRAIVDACYLIMDFMDPQMIGSKDEYMEMYGQLKKYEYCMPDEVIQIFEEFVDAHLKSYGCGEKDIYNMEYYAPGCTKFEEMPKDKWAEMTKAAHEVVEGFAKEFEDNYIRGKLKEYILGN